LVSLPNKLELRFNCKNLEHSGELYIYLKLITKSLKDSNEIVNEYETDVIKGTKNPVFLNPIIVTYEEEEGEKEQSLVVSVKDKNPSSKMNTPTITIKMQDIMNAPDGRFTSQLGKSEIIIDSEFVAVDSLDTVLEMSFFGTKLDNKDVIGKSDPYLVFNQVRADGIIIPVFKSQIIKNNLNPIWDAFSLSLQTLCNCNLYRTILVECYDYDSVGSDDLIGTFSFTVDQVLNRPVPQEFELKIKNKGQTKTSGMITLDYYSIIESCDCISNASKRKELFENQFLIKQKQLKHFQDHLSLMQHRQLLRKIYKGIKPVSISLNAAKTVTISRLPLTCKEAESIIVNGVDRIPSFAFSDSKATSITLPNSLTKIADNAFNSASKLKSIVIPDSVTDFDESVFFRCDALESVVLPASLKTIPDSTFIECKHLKSVNIPDSVTSIEKSAFDSCIRLESITLPNSLTSIDLFAFNHCVNLKSITIPDSVTSIANKAFYGCCSLASVKLPASLSTITNCLFFSSGLTSVTFPSSITTIGPFSFEACENLTSVTLPDSVTVIDDAAFRSCTNLSSINIPHSVTRIGEAAFGACESLKSITIPKDCECPKSFDVFGGGTKIIRK